MKIERVTRYSVMGHEFESIAKAQDHIDGEVNKILQRELMGQSFGLTGGEIIKITDVLLKHRKTFANLLSVELPDEINDF